MTPKELLPYILAAIEEGLGDNDIIINIDYEGKKGNLVDTNGYSCWDGESSHANIYSADDPLSFQIETNEDD